MSSLQGFSKLLGANTANFIPFDKNQLCGRPIFINKVLVHAMTGFNDTDFDTICSRIRQLAAKAGGIDAYSCTTDAGAHKTRIGSTFVAYKIFQNTGDPDYPPGVYITRLTKASYVDGEPAPFLTTFQDDEWELQTDKVKRVNTPYAAINGLCKNHLQAAQDILPEMLEKSWENRKWADLVPETVRQTGFTMMYNPPSLYENGKHWLTPEQKKWTKADAAIQLAQQLIDIQKRGQTTLWTIHGSGAELFHRALNYVNTSLDKQTFMFCAPTLPLSKIASQAKLKGFNIHDDVLKINADDWRSRKPQAEDAAALRDALLELEGFEEKALDLFEEARGDLYKLGSTLTNSLSLGGKVAGYIVNPLSAGADTIKHLGKGPGAIRDDIRKIKSLRNTAANNSKDHKINPHMHPFKSGAQTNRLVDRASFVDIVKGIARS